jgi:FkbM family methyltransferase
MTDIASMGRSLKLQASAFKRMMIQHAPSAHDAGRIYETPEGLFAAPAGDVIFPTILRQGKSYGADEIARIKQIVPKGGSILVVGGHVGTLAIPLSRHASRVTVIEANPRTFRYLAANVALNERDNITLIQRAAGERAGVIEFVASKANTGGSKRKPAIANPMYYYDNPDTISVPMDRLDDMLVENFDGIVMDIEGSEYFALQGMPRILANAQALFIEFLPHHLDNVSQVTPQELYNAIGVDFCHMLIPSDRAIVEGAGIAPALMHLYQTGRGEDALVFSKTALRL